MACVIELQGYCTKEHGFVPKEVFLICDSVEKKYTIRPIKPYNSFSIEDKKRIDWATRHYHFIPWSSGRFELGEFLRDINKVSSDIKFILSKGAEKVAYLSTILNRKVIDIGFYGCPSIRKIELTACPAHFKSESNCAVTSGRFIFDWLNGHPDAGALLDAIKRTSSQVTPSGCVCERSPAKEAEQASCNNCTH
jgi:hypothetical protein